MKQRNTAWLEEELNQLAEFVAAGGTPLRASVRFRRTVISCRTAARKMGVPFENLNVRRKNMRTKYAAAQQALDR